MTWSVCSLFFSPWSQGRAPFAECFYILCSYVNSIFVQFHTVGIFPGQIFFSSWKLTLKENSLGLLCILWTGSKAEFVNKTFLAFPFNARLYHAITYRCSPLPDHLMHQNRFRNEDAKRGRAGMARPFLCEVELCHRPASTLPFLLDSEE